MGIDRTAPLLLVLCLVVSSVSGGSAEEAAVALRIDNGVLPQAIKGFLTDPRIFNPEFYRKFYPQLRLANDADATREWTSRGANACRRGSFSFNARDYVGRYGDLAKYDCVAAAEHFATAGFNEGRIGAADSYWVVFNFNYYVDAANNSDLSKAYATHVWNQVDLQVHWLQHGIGAPKRLAVLQRRRISGAIRRCSARSGARHFAVRVDGSGERASGPHRMGRARSLERPDPGGCAACRERDAGRRGALVHERPRRSGQGGGQIPGLVPRFADAAVAGA
jgi:hypothetical protein